MNSHKGISTWCIDHPVATILLTFALVLVGVIAFPRLPIAPLPEAEFPTIQVSAQLPGASPDTMASSVATPLEVQFSAIPGMTQMTSSSALGSTLLTLQFTLDKSIDTAAQEVQAAINTAAGKLPKDMPTLPTWKKVNPADSPVLILSVSSTQMPGTELSDLVETLLSRQISQVDGVGQINITGQQRPAIRVQASADKLAAIGLTLADIRLAIQQTSLNLAKGALYGESSISTLSTNDQLFHPEDYSQLIVSYKDGAPVHLRDVAKVVNGAEDAYVQAWAGDRPGVNLVIFRQPGANIVETVDRIQAALPGLEAMLPASVQVKTLIDRTQTIRASLHEVEITLLIAILLVVAVMALFLRQLSATLIVSAVLGVSLIASFALMYILGFSLNNLTLVAIVVAVGFVVDDAIVVVENIHRHIEEGKTPFDAALQGAREIAIPVVSMTITLAAVYAPIGFLEGLTGALFKEFALTLAGAVVISGIVALTLSPMMCALLLRREQNASGLAHRLDRIFDGLKLRYQRLLHGTLDSRPVVVVFAVIILCLIPVLLKFTQNELAPDEDQGVIFMISSAPQPTNLDYLNTYTNQYTGIFKGFPEYYSSFQINGFNGVQSGIGGFLLKPWNERERSQMELLPLVQAKLAEIAGLQIFGFNLPALPGTGEGLPFQFVINTAGDYPALLEVAQRVKERAQASGKFAFLDIDLAFDKPEVVVDIDRAKAAQMGVSMDVLGGTLATLLGEGEINRFTLEGRSYKVIAQVERAYRDNPHWLNSYYVKNNQGQLLPLSTLITLSDRARPRQLNQFQQLNSAIIQGVPLVSMDEALAMVRQIAGEEAPEGFSFDYAGVSRQFVQEGSALWVTFGLALAIIFLVLAAQFESFRDPLVILVTVPLSICGALLPLFLGLSSMNIYTQVGLVTLIGLITKHGILIVEFANQLRKDKGLDVREAIEEAAAIRLRPVLMTTAAMVFGMLPLILATGAGAVSRFDIGMVIATGMSIGTLFTLFVLPCIYTLLAHKTVAREAEVTRV